MFLVRESIIEVLKRSITPVVSAVGLYTVNRLDHLLEIRLWRLVSVHADTHEQLFNRGYFHDLH